MAKRQITSHWTGPNEGWTLVVHGGAGQIRRDRIDAETEAHARAALAQALDAGAAILTSGGSAP